jgi:hypothetical protein
MTGCASNCKTSACSTQREFKIIQAISRTTLSTARANYNATTGCYETTIPGQPVSTLVEYKIAAYDKAGNSRTEDNARQYYSYKTVARAILGDVNGDGTVNIKDLFLVAKAFGTKEGDDGYSPIADLDNNKEIDIMDLYTVARDYGRAV